MNNTKIIFGILYLAFITSCGNSDTDEKSKEAGMEELDASIGKYQTVVDDFCKCITEKQAADCDAEFLNVTLKRKDIDVPLEKCIKNKYIDGDGYKKIDEKISGITANVTTCMKEVKEKTLNEMSEENTEGNADGNKEANDEIVKKPLKAPVVIEEEHHQEEEEEHHHDEPY